MKVCVVGAGAIGSWIGARLAGAGNEVCLVSRGEHLAEIRAHGLRLVSGGTEEHVQVPAADRPEGFGVQDVVFLTVKAHSLSGVLPSVQALLGPHTAVVPAVNGIPWWYFHREGGPLESSSLSSVDPGGVLLRSLDPARIVGCVVFASAEVRDPGVVTLVSGNRVVLGEPDNTLSDRLGTIAELLGSARIDAEVTTEIRGHIWAKLLGNVTHNPLSALTLAHIDELYRHPASVGLIRAMMEETAAVAGALGVTMSISVDERLQNSARLGPVKPSMWQDLEKGRPLEVQAIVGAVVELAHKLSVPILTIEVVHALIEERARHLGPRPKQ